MAVPRRKKPRRKRAPGSVGLTADATALDPTQVPEAARALARRVADDGGVALATYREPLGGTAVVFAALPLARVEPTPYQRDVSEAHARRLADVIDRLGRYLDPIVAVPAPGGGYQTPNGNHRCAALRRLGARAITALVVPDAEVAFKILALNVEKAHNLRERALEVIRMARAIVAGAPGVAGGAAAEASYALEFEEPALLTLGLCYQRKPRFSGGAYHPVLRRTEEFSDHALDRALAARERRADLIVEIDGLVDAAIARLRARGLQSPYLRAFVVARINPLRPLRFGPDAGGGDPDEVLRKMRDAARKFNPERVRPEDLSRAAGPPDGD